MKSDIVVIGGGASGLMAAYAAADFLVRSGSDASVLVLEKMPRPARKIMISGKGRCNFTNVKDWNAFSPHVKANAGALRPAFYNLTPEALIGFFDEYGMRSVVERGDRAFPESHYASDVVDALVRACNSKGVKIMCEAEVVSVARKEEKFLLELASGENCECSKLLLATGGLSYPTTGSTGDGYAWARTFGHRIVGTFPSLTALVPAGYKQKEAIRQDPQLPHHIDRGTPLSELGGKLCGVHLKNVQMTLETDGNPVAEEFGDVDFTDGGIEGPLGFRFSRQAVKVMMNGGHAALTIDLKSAVPVQELAERVNQLYAGIDADPRSVRLREKEKCRILLGKLMPWDLIPGFTAMNPGILSISRLRSGRQIVKIRLDAIVQALKNWRFPLEGYVGYERAVVTAGGVALDGIVAKSLESKLVPGLHFCGELLDIDADTGGYNLHSAFATGALAGLGAAKSLLASRG